MRIIARLVILATASLCLLSSAEAQSDRDARAYIEKRFGPRSPATPAAPVAIRVEKYQDVRRAAKGVDSAVKVGIAYRDFAPLLQKFQTEIEMLPKPNGEQERTLVATYQKAADIYTFGNFVWGMRFEDQGNGSRESNREGFGVCDSVLCSHLEEYGVAMVPDNAHVYGYGRKLFMYDHAVHRIFDRGHGVLMQADVVFD
jgi:hypothetical protein